MPPNLTYWVLLEFSSEMFRNFRQEVTNNSSFFPFLFDIRTSWRARYEWYSSLNSGPWKGQEEKTSFKNEKKMDPIENVWNLISWNLNVCWLGCQWRSKLFICVSHSDALKITCWTNDLASSLRRNYYSFHQCTKYINTCNTFKRERSLPLAPCLACHPEVA